MFRNHFFYLGLGLFDNKTGRAWSDRPTIAQHVAGQIEFLCAPVALACLERQSLMLNNVKYQLCAVEAFATAQPEAP